MDFGMALIALKRGETVARKGWNGKGMFLTLQNGSTVDGNNMRNEGAKKYYEDAQCTIAPHIDMKSADGTYIAGYLNTRTVYTKEYKMYCLLMCIISDEVDFDFWFNKGHYEEKRNNSVAKSANISIEYSCRRL